MPARPLAGVEALLVDLDGVLYVGDAPIAGAREAVAALRAAGLALRFVTNTTSRSRAATLAHLRALGFAVADEELITPAALALRRCRERGHRTAMLAMNDEVKRDFAGLREVEHGADAVIVGDLGARFGYDVLNRAFRLVLDGAELIALQKNRFWRTPDGLSLDVGPFVAALEYATGVEAYVVGKPAAAFFALPLAQLGVAPAAAAMVGDDVESDVGGALAAGLRAVLVRTGKHREETLRASGVTPTVVVDSIADVADALAADR